MKTAAEMREEVTQRAAADPAIRQRLVESPKQAIAEVLGVEIPDSIEVRVHEEDAATAHIVLPPPAALDAAALATVTAGFSSAPESMNVLNW